MKHRPIDKFIRRFRIEPVPNNLRNKFISRFRCGGLQKFESNVISKMGDVKLIQFVYTDPLSKERLLWKYVGDLWWCRKHNDKYEFSRLVAYVNKPGRMDEIDGLWDAGRHVTKQPLIVVHNGDVKGFVVGYNDFEVLVEWCDKLTGARLLAAPVRSMNDLRFEFIEDHKLFFKVFSNIHKNERKRVVKKMV
jgi:hypothetical protein